MRGATVKGLILGVLMLAGFGAVAAGALAAPTSTSAPSIAGKPVFLSKLTCNRGGWSPDAVSFDYAWAYANGGTFASGQTLSLDRISLLNYAVECVVTAHDASGATTSAASPAVTVTAAAPKIHITHASGSHQHIVISGTISPGQANHPHGQLVLYRKAPGALYQLIFGNHTTNAGGHFTLKVKDTVHGKHTYVVAFIPSAPGFVNEVLTNVKITVR